MADYTKQLAAVDLAAQKLQAKRFRIIEKAAKSDDPTNMVAAALAIQKQAQAKALDTKAYLIDPLQFNANLGYKDKRFSLTYTTLSRMAKTPIINAIIKTRKNQVADYAEPQNNHYSTGFIIRKKLREGQDDKMDRRESKEANRITDFILNCGNEVTWESIDFDSFIRMLVEDSLTYDQMTFECIRNRKGELTNVLPVDAATFRMAESAFKDDYDNKFFNRRGYTNWAGTLPEEQRKRINGYLPKYVQIYEGTVVEEFYPWELCFGVRNPSTSIYSNGYGKSELEELVNIVTALLWGDEYNRRFFSQGSAPKGLLRVKGNINQASLEEFKQQWRAMISGVMQSWKTPVVQADVDWIDLQKSNRDMEYTEWTEYLIKLACAIYCIDPSEIGWDIARSGGDSGLFEKSEAERIQNSKDKGLYPLLKFLQRKINRYIVEQINPDYEFQFMGLNGMTIDQELEMDVKKLTNFQTLNEIRQKWNLEPVEGDKGNLILNPYYIQAAQAEQQQAMNAQMGGMGYGNEGGYSGEEEPEGEENGEEESNADDIDWDSYFSGDGSDNEEENGNEEGTEQDEETTEEETEEPNSAEEENNEEETEEESYEENEEEDEDEKKRKKAHGNDIFVKAFESYLNEEAEKLENNNK